MNEDRWEKVAGVRNLYLRGEIYYFKGKVGTTVRRWSLGTTDLEEAKRLIRPHHFEQFGLLEKEIEQRERELAGLKEQHRRLALEIGASTVSICLVDTVRMVEPNADRDSHRDSRL